ncbi:SGNH/GDSL hydrolase family protein [Aquirhabdus sp.]|uniref:SGNH/GDSL hydrolase family protein n=1 Tax=Aquirhabdus sp. TaxID=2824160 RepID=UPI00396C80B1
MRSHNSGVATLALAIGLLTIAPAALAVDYSPYVALGDSYTAAPGILPLAGIPIGCTRSANNYPHQVASIIGASLTDVSCGSATTANMTQSQFVGDGSNAPQFDALSTNTKLVTVGIGGNDVPFGEIAGVCAGLGVTNPWGSPCKDFYNITGTDQGIAKANAVGPKIATVVQGIHSRSPNAKILVVGYPMVVPAAGGTVCFNYAVPIAAGDLPYVNQIEQTMNSAIKTAAEANGAVFVDIYQSSIGHDACQPGSAQWVNGIIPTSTGYWPVHPTLAGEQNIANQVLTKLDY